MNKKVIKESELRQIVQGIIKEAKDKEIYLGTKKNPVSSGEKPKEVKMNAHDNEGTSGKAASLVSVDASSSASNSASGKGMKKANFDTKSGFDCANAASRTRAPGAVPDFGNCLLKTNSLCSTIRFL